MRKVQYFCDFCESQVPKGENMLCEPVYVSLNTGRAAIAVSLVDAELIYDANGEEIEVDFHGKEKPADCVCKKCAADFFSKIFKEGALPNI